MGESDEELSDESERRKKENGKADPENGLTPDLEEELDSAIKEVSKTQSSASSEEIEAGYGEIKGFKKVKPKVKDPSEFSFLGVDYTEGGSDDDTSPGKVKADDTSKEAGQKSQAAPAVKVGRKKAKHKKRPSKATARKKRRKVTTPDMIEKERPDLKIITLSGIHSAVRKEKVPEHFRITDQKIDNIENILNNKVPLFKKSLRGVSGQLDSHKSVMDDVNRRETELQSEVAGIKESINILRDEVLGAVEKKSVRGQMIDRMMNDTAKEINRRVNTMYRGLEKSFETIKKRIDENTKIGKLEMASNIDYLKSQIDSIKDDVDDMKKMKKRVKAKTVPAKAPKKPESKKAVIKAPEEEKPKPAESSPKKEQQKPEPKKEEIKEAPEEKPEEPKEEKKPEAPSSEEKKPLEEKVVDAEAVQEPPSSVVEVKDISKFSGKEILLEGELKHTKTVEDGDEKMYGYMLKDDSGEVMMTSSQELKEEKMKVKALVNETGSKRFYVRFIERK